jgi:cytochrome c2
MVNKNGILCIIALLLVALLSACSETQSTEGATAETLVPEGSPEAGATLIEQYGCGSCHIIPGITNADGMVGPPLTGWADRSIIAGMLPNTPENLITWLMDPKAINPETAMPDVGLNEQGAQDIAAYLYTLQGEE